MKARRRLLDHVIINFAQKAISPRRVTISVETIWRAGCAARQAHRENRAFARLSRHRHVAAHHACELASDGKTKAGAAKSLRRRLA